MTGSERLAGARTGVRAWHWLVLAAAWFATMGWRPLLEPDEGRYAEIPREMSTTGDWVTPRLNGVKYFEKPALVYWSTASLYSIFGVKEWTARFWPCAFAFSCLPLVYLFARRAYGTPEAGFGAVSALALNPYFVFVGQLNLLDSALMLFMTGTVFAFLRARDAPPASQSERRWMMLAALSLSLAVLSKGIVALVLAGGTLLIHMIVTREVRGLRRWHLPFTLPLFCAVTVPWFVAVSARNPEFFDFFFIHEHFARYLTDVSDRVAPWWFFLPFLLLAVLPWIAGIVPSARTLWRSDVPDNPDRSVMWFLAIWCGFTLLFFSFSHSKLPTYILPMMPALAVLLARARNAPWISLGFVALVATGLIVATFRKTQIATPALFAWPAAAVILSVVSLMSAKRYWIAHAATSLLSFQALMMSYSALPPVRTAKPLVAATRASIGPGTVLYSIGQYRQSIPPYLGRTLRIGLYRGELDFGLTQKGGSHIDTAQAFVTEWLGQSDAVAFVEPGLYRQLNEQGVPMRVLASDGRSVAVARN